MEQYPRRKPVFLRLNSEDAPVHCTSDETILAPVSHSFFPHLLIVPIDVLDVFWPDKTAVSKSSKLAYETIWLQLLQMGVETDVGSVVHKIQFVSQF